jgi:hypothetical protein
MPFGLGEKDVQALLDIAGSAGRDAAGPVLPWSLLHELRGLVACDVISVSGQDTPRRREFAAQVLPGIDAGEPGTDAYWAHYWDSPC